LVFPVDKKIAAGRPKGIILIVRPEQFCCRIEVGAYPKPLVGEKRRADVEIEESDIFPGTDQFHCPFSIFSRLSSVAASAAL
jgi:hypothetical protein